MIRSSRRLAAVVAALLLALPLAACQQDGGTEPSVTTDEADEPITPDDPGAPEPEASPGTDDGS